MRTIVFMLIATILMALCITVYGAEPVPADTSSLMWAVRGVGSGDMFKGEFGLRPGLLEDRTEFGVYGQWLDGLGVDKVESLGLGLYATYDVIKDAPFKIWEFSVPSTIYVGTSLGALKPHRADWDATASLMSGINFGDRTVRIGFRFEYLLTNNFWRELADIPDDARALATVEYRF